MKAKIILLAMLFAILVLTPTLIVAIDSGTDGPSTDPGILADSAIIQLRDPPLASYQGGVNGYKTIPYGITKKIDLSSPEAKAYSNYLAGQRGNLKNWLASNAPWAVVTNEYSVTFNGVAVQLNGHSTKSLSSGPGVNGVYNDYLFTLQMNRSPALINAPALWSAVGGQSNAGAGIKIGIIDSGIDNTHPYLTDSSLSVPAGFPLCDARDASICSSITSNKVIVAKVYNEPDTNFDAHAAQDHGSHVSGIAAGVAGTPCGAGFPSGCTLSGIAPKAWLGNYNVFPGTVLDASSHAIAQAVEDAVTDGMDVLNLSLGGTPRPGDILVNAVNSAVDAGVVVAIAAGNAGPGLGTVESPGIAANVITVGASTNPHFMGIPVTGTTTAMTSFSFGGVTGQFANYVPAVTASYQKTIPANGCTAITNSVSTKIAVINRGTCSFSTKIRNAQTAGAVGAIIVNSQVGDPIVMAQDGTPGQPTIPAVMIGNANGPVIDTTGTVTVDGTMPHEFYSDGPSADILASFSSWGPVAIGTALGNGIGTTIIKDYIKPDVVAPGLNVYSSIRMASCATPPCYAFFSGTSMATPHVAGSAAVLKQLHPDWTPQEIKSALSNTATRPVRLFTNGSTVNDPVMRGVGRIDLGAAATFGALVSTDRGQVQIDFGTLPSSSVVRTNNIVLTSIAASPVTYTVTVTGTGVTTDTSTFTLSAGGTQTMGVTLQLSPTQPVGEYFGDITISGGSVTLHVPFWYLVNSPSGGHGHNPI